MSAGWTRLDRLEAIFITHAHEDHIGALAAFGRKLQKKVYCPPLHRHHRPAEVRRGGPAGRPDRHRRTAPRRRSRPGRSRCSSCPCRIRSRKASALIIDTPAGRIFHSADFKIDHDPVVGEAWDDARIAEIAAERPVKAMMCDSHQRLFHPCRPVGKHAGRAADRPDQEAPAAWSWPPPSGRTSRV